MTPGPTAPPKGAPKAPPIPPPGPPVGAAPAPVKAPPFGALPPLKTPRVVLNCVEGWGKTSCAAFAPKPGLILSQGETGYQTLLGAGLVPDVPAVVVNSWDELLAVLDGLAKACEFETLALDALDGFEAMCHQMVTTRDFGGERGDKGFLSYHKGYDLAVGDWVGMLQRLDRIHTQGVAILLLSHSLDKTVANPHGADYARTIGNAHAKTWAATKRWGDAVLFGAFDDLVDKVKGKPKGIGGQGRLLYCEHRAAFDAKNRYAMPYKLDIPANPKDIWSTIIENMNGNGKEA